MARSSTSFKPGHTLISTNPGKHKVYNQKFILDLIPGLIEWSQRDDAWVFNTWIADQNLCQERVWEFAQAEPLFAKELKSAKLRVAQRRELLAMKGKCSEGIVRHTMHVYDRELMNSMLELKRAGIADQPTGTINVIVSGRSLSKQAMAPKKRSKKAK
jgi:hypothetical protein